ncbi:hypothetical protein [Chryseobacterium shigense]|uniref:Uncharacterized protein n=1 Tax=Chryseobacterium shigense TaxID=297244 RepID=A0A841N6N6_9FLAO|nr:hypothetical protein [Chryseobacterium shigense]MBB6370371.1 hypothetical protein [Chryseobacterium shigense]
MKTKLLFWAGILFLSAHAYSQVGINTPTPSSTMDVRGSVEGNFREIITTTIPATEVLNPKDYHVSFSGTADLTLSLPSKSATDGTAADFMGRKYYIKNNSTSNILTLTAASGQIMRLGGYIANTGTFVLRPGKFATLTASGINGWDLDADVNQSLVDYNSSTPVTGGQLSGLPAGNNYVTIPGSSVTVTVPSSNAKVVLNFTGYTMVYGSSINAYGSLRFQIAQTGTATTTYGSVSMVSWYQNNTPNPTPIAYSNFGTLYSISGLTPGTYTFTLQAKREYEGGTVGDVRVYHAIGRADVYLK